MDLNGVTGIHGIQLSGKKHQTQLFIEKIILSLNMTHLW